MMLTVEVAGYDLVVDFDGEPFQPARITGDPDTSYPASGGEATINYVYLNGTEIRPLLEDNAVVMGIIEQRCTRYLCSFTPAELAFQED